MTVPENMKVVAARNVWKSFIFPKKKQKKIGQVLIKEEIFLISQGQDYDPG
jgi:hypothetical protein